MGLILDRWTTAAGTALILAALLACKKDEEKAPEPIASVAAPASVAPEPVKEEEDAGAAEDAGEADAAEDADAGEVVEIKRYPDKEEPESGKVKVLVDELKVFAAADDKLDPLTTLKKETEVELKAKYGTYYLIEYPADEGAKTDEPPTGWVNATSKGVISEQESTKPKPVVTPTNPAPAEKSKRRRRRKKKTAKD